MKRKSHKKMLRQFQEEINDFVKDFADCSICGVCCVDENLTLFNPDIDQLSKKLGIDRKIFLEKYTNYNNESKEILMNMPCSFFKNGKCSVYSIRPNICRNYPIYVLKEGFVRVVEIEGCVISTHFNELFLDYCKKYHPDFYKKVNATDKDYTNENYIKNVIYSINLVALFIQWLHKPK